MATSPNERRPSRASGLNGFALKRLTRVILLLLGSVALIIGGCGGDNKKSSSTKNPSEAAMRSMARTLDSARIDDSSLANSIADLARSLQDMSDLPVDSSLAADVASLLIGAMDTSNPRMG